MERGIVGESTKMYACEKCKKEFNKRLHLLRHVQQVHAVRKGTKREAPEATEADENASKSNSKARKMEQKPLGDRWPKQQLVMLTGTVGDIVPWSSQQDMMLLAPAVLCAVAIPRGWNSKSACGLMGVDARQLRRARQSSHPTYDTLREELQTVLDCYRSDRGEDSD